MTGVMATQLAALAAPGLPIPGTMHLPGTVLANVTGTADVGGTEIEITTDVPHGRANGDILRIASITGTTEANGVFAITVTATDKFKIGVPFANAWVSGGTIAIGGGALLTVPMATDGVYVVMLDLTCFAGSGLYPTARFYVGRIELFVHVVSGAIAEAGVVEVYSPTNNLIEFDGSGTYINGTLTAGVATIYLKGDSMMPQRWDATVRSTYVAAP